VLHWGEESDAQQLMRKALAAGLNYNLARALRKWLAYHQLRRIQLEVVNAALSRWRKQHLSRAYNSLVENARLMRLMQAAINRWNQLHLTQAWNTWLDRAAMANENLRLIRKGVGRMRMGDVARALDRWRDEAARLRRINQLLRRSALRWSRGQLFVYFHYLSDLCEAMQLRELEFSAHLTSTYRTKTPKARASGSWFGGGSASSSPMPTNASEMVAPGADTSKVNTTLYVLGGQDGLGRGCSDVEKMGSDTGQWTNWLTDENSATDRLGHGTVSVDGLIYIIGGRSAAKENKIKFNSMYIVTGATADGAAVTQEAAPMTCRRNNVAVAHLQDHKKNHKIFALGGGNGVQRAQDSCEVYSVNRGRWKNINPMHVKRCLHCAAVIEDKIYVIGGSDGAGTDHLSCERYDSISGEWSTIAPLNEPRTSATCVVLEGAIYVFGGIIRVEGPDTYLESIERYDPASDTWTQCGKMPGGLSHASADRCGGFIYVAGGQTITPHSPYPIVLDDVHRYDPNTGVWQPMPSLRNKRSHHVLVAAREARDTTGDGVADTM
jgi:N-acetylneuraminic acid mutarotase